MDMGGADLVALGQMRQRQRHGVIPHHQVQHAGVEAAHRMAQQPAHVGQAPAVIGQMGQKCRHDGRSRGCYAVFQYAAFSQAN